MKIVHYVNQFFAGMGGEDSAGTGPEIRDGAVGPGRKLAALLGEEHEIIATAICGDDYAASHPEFAATLVEQAKDRGAEMIIAGPAFTSGRYGMAAARMAAAAGEAGLAALASMHPENPGLGEAAGTTVVESGQTARKMKESLERFAAAARKVAAGVTLSKSGSGISVASLSPPSRVSTRSTARSAAFLSAR